MKKVIILPHGCINELARIFNCSRYTVSDALRTDKPGPKKDRIRRYISEKYSRNIRPIKQEDY